MTLGPFFPREFGQGANDLTPALGEGRQRNLFVQDDKTWSVPGPRAAHQLPDPLFRADAAAADGDVLRERQRPGAERGPARIAARAADREKAGKYVHVRHPAARRRRDALLWRLRWPSSATCCRTGCTRSRTCSR